jgi:hypothetical protein
MGLCWWRAVLAMALVLLTSIPVRAEFHFAVIDEVMSGCGADPTIQFVEIRMLSGGQTQVANTRLTAFSCDGSSVQVLRLVATNLLNSGNGTRWIIGSPNFEAAAGIAPDSVMSDADPGIFPTCGQICWGAPGASAPDPGTWDHTDPNNYIDCVAYGEYTGARPSGAGPLLTDTPSTGTQSLTRVSTSPNADDNDFALAAPTPRNNNGMTGSLAGCSGLTTTSTAPPSGGSTTSTTTSGGGSTTSTTIGSALPGGGPAKTDCFAGWRVLGATGGTPVVRCTDNDTACDQSPAAGCLIRAQLCFNDAGAAAYGGKCTASPVTGFVVTGKPSGQNATALAAALQGLPGVQTTVDGTAFAPALATLTCTGPIDLEVPLAVKGTTTKKGVRSIRSVTTAAKRDKDKLKILCIP